LAAAGSGISMDPLQSGQRTFFAGQFVFDISFPRTDAANLDGHSDADFQQRDRAGAQPGPVWNEGSGREWNSGDCR